MEAFLKRERERVAVSSIKTGPEENSAVVDLRNPVLGMMKAVATRIDPTGLLSSELVDKISQMVTE